MSRLLAKPCLDPNNVENIVAKMLEVARNEATREKGWSAHGSSSRTGASGKTLAAIEHLQG